MVSLYFTVGVTFITPVLKPGGFEEGIVITKEILAPRTC